MKILLHQLKFTPSLTFTLILPAFSGEAHSSGERDATFVPPSSGRDVVLVFPCLLECDCAMYHTEANKTQVTKSIQSLMRTFVSGLYPLGGSKSPWGNNYGFPRQPLPQFRHDLSPHLSNNLPGDKYALDWFSALAKSVSVVSCVKRSQSSLWKL